MPLSNQMPVSAPTKSKMIMADEVEAMLRLTFSSICSYETLCINPMMPAKIPASIKAN